MSELRRPAVSVVIVNYNGGDLLLECVGKLFERTTLPAEVFLVDNASRDGSARAVCERFPDVELIENPHNAGFARASNQGIARARAPYVLLLNPDVVIGPRAVDIVHTFMEAHAAVGICGPRVLLPSGRLDRPCRRSFKTPGTYLYKTLGLSALFPRHRTFGRYYLGYLDERQTTEVDAVIGAFLMARRGLIERIGLLDERFFLYCEDEDWCFRARCCGFKVVYLPEATVVHHKGTCARQRTIRSLYEWHRAVSQFHRKNIAPDCGSVVNGLVYAGMGATFAARVALASLKKFPRALAMLGPRGSARPTHALASGLEICSQSPAERLVKRGLDVLVSAAGLILLSPLMALIALAVKLSSPGPILYRWKVVGEGGRPFTGYKFRSMHPNADELKPALECRNEMKGPVFKMSGDPRITPLGRLLRRYSLDELPQMWSVLKGDMSLVGPRPPLQTEFERFEPWQRAKVCVRPGLTCLWQVRGRSDIRDFSDWVRMDLEYVRRRSLWLDIQILALTIPAVVRAKGAR